jgi:hypothetical protein
MPDSSLLWGGYLFMVVAASLAIGPIATLAEDYFFPEGAGQQLAVKAMSFVR